MKGCVDDMEIKVRRVSLRDGYIKNQYMNYYFHVSPIVFLNDLHNRKVGVNYTGEAFQVELPRDGVVFYVETNNKLLTKLFDREGSYE